MDKAHLRTEFEKEKVFLKKLFLKDHSLQVLSSAEDDSLNILIKILHMIFLHEIPLNKQNIDTIIKSKRSKKLEKFKSKSYFIELLHGGRQNKIKTLNQFITLYPIFLHGFFHDDHKS
jgi:hypothetical protein